MKLPSPQPFGICIGAGAGLAYCVYRGVDWQFMVALVGIMGASFLMWYAGVH